jgi:type II secretory pathway pseudopilin PulG
MKHNLKKQGFTLVEIAIILMLVGLAVGAVFSFRGPQNDQEALKITRDNQKKIATAIAIYTQKNNKIPCPGYQYDFWAPNKGTIIPGCSAVGIVPYMDLGLLEEDILDGYGNPFDYVVAREAGNPNPGFNAIHGNCRLNGTWNLSGANVNRDKAAFCCQQSSSGDNLRVFMNSSKTSSVVPVQNGSFSGTFSAVDAVETTSYPDKLTYLAYALISHGKNKAVTMIMNSAYRAPVTPDVSTEEQENADSNNEVLDLPENLGTPYFDDVVMWRTQEMIMSEFGNNSCAVP